MKIGNRNLAPGPDAESATFHRHQPQSFAAVVQKNLVSSAILATCAKPRDTRSLSESSQQAYRVFAQCATPAFRAVLMLARGVNYAGGDLKANLIETI
jgi:hypothetical protein